MYAIGNVAENLGRDSSDIPVSLVKTLQARHQSIRDPLLLQRDDTAFNDMIRQLAFEELERPTSSGNECEKVGDLDIVKSQGIYAVARDAATASHTNAFFPRRTYLSANKKVLGAKRRFMSTFKQIMARLCSGD